mgnify:FL=1
MKKLLLATLLALPLFCAAQECKDTSYTLNQGGIFFDITRTDCSDGTYTEVKSIVGDTAAMVSRYANKMVSDATPVASAAITAMRASQLLTSLIRFDTLATAQLGKSPLTAVMASYEREFLSGSWVLEYNGTTTAVTFPRLSTNQRIRLLPAGGTARTFLFPGPMARLVNYPITGNNVLFRYKEGYWMSFAYRFQDRIILRRQGVTFNSR